MDTSRKNMLSILENPAAKTAQIILLGKVS